MSRLISNEPMLATCSYFTVMISGWLAKVRFNSSSASMSSPCANSSIKWSEGCVSPRSSLEIEDTSHLQAAAKATCERFCSVLSSLSASPNASSVFNPRILAGIDDLVYRNIFLVCRALQFFQRSSEAHVDDFNPPAYSLV